MLVLGRVCDAKMRRLKVVPVVLDLVRYYISYCTCFTLLKQLHVNIKLKAGKVALDTLCHYGFRSAFVLTRSLDDAFYA